MPKREKFPFVNTLLKLTNGEYKYYVRRRCYDDVPKIGRLTEFDDEFVDTINIDMMYLKSKLTNTEIDVYEWELEDYKVKHSESTIYIKLKNKPEVAIMY